MNFKLTALAVFSLAACAAIPSQAQEMKPGLWDIDTKLSGGDPMMQQKMAEMQKQMTPEQRKMMESMMAKSTGGAMPTMTADGIRLQICATKEMATQSFMPVQKNGSCTQTRGPVVAGSMKIAYSCTEPVSSGEGTVKFSGNSGYSLDMTMTSRGADGKPEKKTMSSTGKWLSSNCGSVKPLAMPASK